jgi:glycosyltransferase involved in cell wall biosynthesis
MKGYSNNTVVVVGCSGYGNIGDDLYPEVLKKYIKQTNFIFKNSDEPRKLDRKCKVLIMGPGGIIYQGKTAHFHYMSQYMDQAIKKNIPIFFISCGVQSEDISAWKKYLDYAEVITVRSESDLKSIKEISNNKNIFYYPDLGYIYNEYTAVQNLPKKYTVFCPVTGSLDESIYINTPEKERVLLRMASRTDTDVLYKYWLDKGKALLIDETNPAMANFVIKNSQMVYTGRYHGMVLARKNNIPFDTGNARQRKILTEDRGNSIGEAMKHITILRDYLSKYLKYKKPRIALIHDDFTLSGGGEKLISILCKNLNQKGYYSEIFTFDISDNTKKMIDNDIKINTLRYQDMTEINDSIKRFTFSELDINKLDVDNKFDFFIFSGHPSLCALYKNKPNTLYSHNVPKSEPSFPKIPPTELIERISDCENMEIRNKHDVQVYLNKTQKIHMLEKFWRKAYGLKTQYISDPILPGFISTRIDALRYLLNKNVNINKLKFLTYQYTNKENIKNVDSIITNSENIRQKVKNTYSRESKVIYPPIETKKYNPLPHEGYWLSINRLVPLKRIELQINAFKYMPEQKLYIIGDKENKDYYDYLNSIKSENIVFLGVVNEKEKIDKLSKCKGLIFTASDEDFGMSVVEAMASGKPVIAPNEGGCRETIQDGVTGILINNIDSQKIVQAVYKIEENGFEKYKDKCMSRAKMFDVESFTNSIIEHIEERLGYNAKI